MDNLTPAAQAILDATIRGAREGGAKAAQRAMEKASVELSFSLPPGRKHEVQERLMEIVLAHAMSAAGAQRASA